MVWDSCTVRRARISENIDRKRSQERSRSPPIVSSCDAVKSHPIYRFRAISTERSLYSRRTHGTIRTNGHVPRRGRRLGPAPRRDFLPSRGDWRTRRRPGGGWRYGGRCESCRGHRRRGVHFARLESLPDQRYRRVPPPRRRRRCRCRCWPLLPLSLPICQIGLFTLTHAASSFYFFWVWRWCFSLTVVARGDVPTSSDRFAHGDVPARVHLSARSDVPAASRRYSSFRLVDP